MATHKHCTYIKQRRKSRFIFPWQVQDHITCHTKCKALNHRARFSLHTTARHKLMSLYQFISKSLVWAWVCLIEWTPTWARFGSDFMAFSNHLAKWKKKKNLLECTHIPSKRRWSVQTIWVWKQQNLSLMEWKSAWRKLSFFLFLHTQGDLPSYSSEDKSPLGTLLTNTVWSDVVLDLCLEGCSSWWQSRRGDGSIASCSVCCVTPSRPYALCSPGATLLPYLQSSLSTANNSWRCCCGHIKTT